MKDFTVHIQLDYLQIDIGDNKKTELGLREYGNIDYFQLYDYVEHSLLERFIDNELYFYNDIGYVIDSYEIIDDRKIYLHYDFSKVEDYYSSYNKEQLIIDAVDGCDLYVRLHYEDNFCTDLYDEEYDVIIQCIVKVSDSYPYEE